MYPAKWKSRADTFTCRVKDKRKENYASTTAFTLIAVPFFESRACAAVCLFICLYLCQLVHPDSLAFACWWNSWVRVCECVSSQRTLGSYWVMAAGAEEASWWISSKRNFQKELVCGLCAHTETDAKHKHTLQGGEPLRNELRMYFEFELNSWIWF